MHRAFQTSRAAASGRLCSARSEARAAVSCLENLAGLGVTGLGVMPGKFSFGVRRRAVVCHYFPQTRRPRLGMCGNGEPQNVLRPSDLNFSPDSEGNCFFRVIRAESICSLMWPPALRTNGHIAFSADCAEKSADCADKITNLRNAGLKRICLCSCHCSWEKPTDTRPRKTKFSRPDTSSSRLGNCQGARVWNQFASKCVPLIEEGDL